jgi:hypothetical protein
MSSKQDENSCEDSGWSINEINDEGTFHSLKVDKDRFISLIRFEKDLSNMTFDFGALFNVTLSSWFLCNILRLFNHMKMRYLIQNGV